jgi:hypothetical protein
VVQYVVHSLSTTYRTVVPALPARHPREFAAAMDSIQVETTHYKRLVRSAQEYARGCTIPACGDHLLSRYKQVIDTYSTNPIHTCTPDRRDETLRKIVAIMYVPGRRIWIYDGSPTCTIVNTLVKTSFVRVLTFT